MPTEAAPGPSLLPLPGGFLEHLQGVDELLVRSRDRFGKGGVRMWFAVVPPGHVWLLTMATSLKAERWRQDPWVELTVPGKGLRQEGVAEVVTWEQAEPHAALLTEPFQLAGAATFEALRWMLEDGSRLLFRVGLAPGSADPVEREQGG